MDSIAMEMTPLLDKEISRDLSENQNVAAIVKKYQAQLKGFIAKRVPSREDSEDILQNVFYQLAKIDLVENPIEQVSAWLYSVARNQIIDWSRKHKEEEMPVYQSADEDGYFVREVTEMLFQEGDSPEMNYLKSLVWEDLKVALEELPDEQKVIFELTELEGMSFKEISEFTGIAVNTLLSRKRYAVLHLRKRLAELYKEILEK